MLSGECMGPFRSGAQVGGAQFSSAQLSSHGRSQTGALTVSFVRAGKGWDETIRRDGREGPREQEQHCNSATRRPHALRGTALRRRQVGPIPPRQRHDRRLQRRSRSVHPAQNPRDSRGILFAIHLVFFLFIACSSSGSSRTLDCPGNYCQN